MITDTHCHLDFDRFDEDRDAVIERARSAGVDRMILIGIDPASWQSTREIVRSFDGFWRTAGLHPNSAASHWDDGLEGALRNEASTGELVAIGETGIDLYRSRTSLEKQLEAFESQIAIAAQSELPIVIHQREAEDEVLTVLRRHGGIEGVMHCFGGDWAFARKCLDLGLHLGIGGVVTFRRSDDVRDAVSKAPADRLLLETDAPFLAPQAVRGRRNEPAFLSHVVEVVARCRNISADEVEEITTRNSSELFGLEQ